MTTILWIIIAILGVVVIVETIVIILLKRSLGNSNQQLKWYNMSSRYR